MNTSRTPGTRTRHWGEISTVATIASFVVVGLTGVMMLVGIGGHAIQGPHEWVGLAFVVAACAHTYRHWKSILWYLKGRALWTAAVVTVFVTVVLTAPAAFSSHNGRGPGPHGLIATVSRAPLERVAPVLNVSSLVLTQRLETAGIPVSGPELTLKQIAEESGRALPEVLEIAMNP